MKKLFILLLVAFATTTFAQYETPDSWRVHYTANGMKATMDGVDIREGTLTLGTAIRNETRLFENDNDNNLHAYLRGRLSGVKLGDGELIISFNLRASTDTSGRAGGPKYNFFYDSLDSSRGDDRWDLRLYNAYVTLDQVIPYTKLSAGRIYIEHLSDLQIDGGDITLGTEQYNAFVYYGLPASYYISNMDTQVLGGGAEANPLPNLRLRVEIMNFFDDNGKDWTGEYKYGDDTLFWKVRGDYTYGLSFAEGTLYASGGMLEDAWYYELGTFGKLTSIGTIYSIWFKGQYDKNDENAISMAISDFDLVNGTQSQYWQLGAKFYQPFKEHFAVGLGYEMRHNFDTYYGDRDYYRVMANFDLIDLWQNSFISITGDWWHVPSDGDYKENNKLYVGGKISQIFNDKFEGWAGASLMNYRYYYKQYDKLPTLETRKNNKLDNNVYVLYAGLGWTPLENLLLQLDYTWESSEVIKEFDAERDQISTISAMVSYNF